MVAVVLAGRGASAGLGPLPDDRPASIVLPRLPAGVSGSSQFRVLCGTGALESGCDASGTLRLDNGNGFSVFVRLPPQWRAANGAQLELHSGQSKTITFGRRVKVVRGSTPLIWGGGILRFRHLVFGPNDSHYHRDVDLYKLAIVVGEELEEDFEAATDNGMTPTAAGNHQVDLDVEYPNGWNPSPHGQHDLKPAGTRRLVGSLPLTPANTYRGRSRGEVAFEVPGSHFDLGGPVVSAYVLFADGRKDGEPGGAVQLSYEAAYDWWLLGSLGVEVGSEGWSVVPSAALTSPAAPLLVFAASAGLGLPVRVHPDPDVGVRLFGELSLFFMSVGGGIDLWTGAGGAEFQVIPFVLTRLAL